MNRVTRYRLLIVEDSSTILAVCRQKLSLYGFQVEGVSSAEAAWEYLGQQKRGRKSFDGILLDWILPGMSAEELLKKIRVVPILKNLPIMIFSEQLDERVVSLAVSDRCYDIQMKSDIDLLPIRMQKFLDNVRYAKSYPKFSEVKKNKPNPKDIILLVDDSPTVLAKYKSLLSEAGYRVVTANGFQSAISAAKKYQPSLAIVDFYMPDGNGDELCKTLLGCDDIADIAIVIFSHSKAIQQGALEAGALDLIYKDDPINIFMLRIAAIMEVVRNKRAIQQVELLVKANDALGIGVLKKNTHGLEAVNSTMESFIEVAGDIKKFDRMGTDKELSISSVDQEEYVFQIAKIPLEDACEAILLQDITLRKKVEQKLQQAKEAAEAANKAKSNFLANMSHELRSPLNSMLILSKLMSENPDLPEEVQKNAKIIHGSGQGLLVLINDLLDMAKVEAGKMTIEIAPMSPKNLVTYLRAQFQPIAEKSKIIFETVIESGIPEMIQSDETRLAQVIRNLLSNAFKFTLENGIVQLSLKTDAQTLIIAVKDTGEGIPEDKLTSIFEAFQQADNTISRRHGGTGLGLKITREFVKLLGGEVFVSSKMGQGSSFCIHLPLQQLLSRKSLVPYANVEKRLDLKSEQKSTYLSKISDPKPVKGLPKLVNGDRVMVEDSLSAESSRSAEGSRPAEGSNLTQDPVLPFSGITVLVVDDQMVNLTVMSKVLELQGCSVILADTGALALEKLHNHPEIKVMLTDIMMPGMDGYELISKVRSKEKWRMLPIIATTASAMKEEVKQCYVSGATDYMSKPLNIELLVQKLNYFL